MRSLFFLLYRPSAALPGCPFVSLPPYICSEGLYGHCFRGYRVIDLWIYVYLPAPLWSLYHKVNAGAGRMMFPSNRSRPVSDSLFWQKHKIQWWLLSSEAGENTVIKKKRMKKKKKEKVYIRPSPFPNCSESGKLLKTWEGKATNLMRMDGLEAAGFIPEDIVRQCLSRMEELLLASECNTEFVTEVRVWDSPRKMAWKDLLFDNYSNFLYSPLPHYTNLGI